MNWLTHEDSELSHSEVQWIDLLTADPCLTFRTKVIFHTWEEHLSSAFLLSNSFKVIVFLAGDDNESS